MSRLLLLSAALAVPAAVLGADWPQWRGPERDGKSKETGLLKQWPEGGPKLLWTARGLGKGYSSESVVGDRLFSMGGAEDNSEFFVFCLDVNTGKELWRTNIGKKFDDRGYSGSRSTPTYDEGKVYAVSGGGELACLDAEDGSPVWSVNMKTDLNGKMMSGWGYSESVLIDGDKLICTPGGDDGTLAALDKTSGEVIWRSDVTDPAAYSSVRVHDIGGVRQYVQLTGKGVVGVRADDGKLLWKNTSLKSSVPALIPTPVIKDDLVFATSGYGVGCVLVRVESEGGGEFSQEEVYTSRTMSNKQGGVILLDGHIYGDNDRQWTCIDLETGEAKWEQGNLSKGSIVYADGHFYCYAERDGTLAMIKATPEDWVEVGRFTIPERSEIRDRGKFWSHPVIANGKLYLRDKDLLFCYDVSGESE